MTYEAEVTVPEPLTAVMAAGPAQRPAATGRTFTFAMPQPIPPSSGACSGPLIRANSARGRVSGRSRKVAAAADEFADVKRARQRGSLWPVCVGALRYAGVAAVVLYGGMENRA